MMIRKSGSGTDLIIETTAIGANGSGVTAGLTVTASIQRMSGSNFYWSTAPAFDSVPEGTLHTLVHQNNGLYAFTLIGGAEILERPYRIHLIITGNVQVNTNATFSDVILAPPLTSAEVNTQADLALSDIFLDQLFAVAYNSAIPSGVATSFLREITENDGGLTRFTANALEQSPTGLLTPTVIADAVWDELISGHITVGSFGISLGAITLPAIADVVWDELRAGHVIAGSFGERVNANLTAIEGALTIDTLPITTMFTNLVSSAQGDVVRVGNTYTYKKQNGSTTTFEYTVSATGRV